MRTTELFAALGLCAIAVAPAWSAEEASVPVTRVTAFSSGVAYFEHNGRVTGDAKVMLKFKAEQINDILKSLVVMDLGGGDVGGVSYGSREPLERALKSFGVDISATSPRRRSGRRLTGWCWEASRRTRRRCRAGRSWRTPAISIGRRWS